MRSMGERVKEAEMSADKDRYVRDKLDEDVARLVRDNARLGQQVVEMKNQLRRVGVVTPDCVSRVDHRLYCCLVLFCGLIWPVLFCGACMASGVLWGDMASVV